AAEPEVTTAAEPEVTTAAQTEAVTSEPEVTTSAPAPSTGETSPVIFVIFGMVFLALAAVMVVRISEKN
ncbi:MAG: LPXTG cell wall anchor domain-containing protein, partial [Clostridia bacterium]|nr:LPXTG cell wall anchor domain-containing protein [Clostridia bacterium]